MKVLHLTDKTADAILKVLSDRVASLQAQVKEEEHKRVPTLLITKAALRDAEIMLLGYQTALRA
jgi:hypothetical protein